MDDFKHVMLTQPPAVVHRPAPPPAPRLSQAPRADAGVRGVLLCERPTIPHHTGPPAFIPPGNALGDLGLPPSLEDQQHAESGRAHVQSKKAPLPAQQRHRAALKELARIKREEKVAEKERQIDDEDFKKRVKDNRERPVERVPYEFRDEPVLKIPTPPVPPHKMYLGAPNKKEEEEEEEEEEEAAAYARPPPMPKPVKSKPKKSKPKWAMSEEEAMEADLACADELLEFTEGLDLERYIDDFEVKEAMAIIRDRVEELKGEGGSDDEGSELGAGNYGGNFLTPGRGRRARSPTASEYSEVSDANDPMHAMAQRIFEKWPELRQKHSKKSIMRVIKAVMEENEKKMGAGGAQKSEKEELLGNLGIDLSRLQQPSHPKPHVQTARPTGDHLPPLSPGAARYALSARGEATEQAGFDVPQHVIIHKHGDGGRADGDYASQQRILTKLKNSQDYVQNLPYMYRCPSI